MAKLLNLTAAASLLLCLALGVLWVRSYRNNWRGDQVGFSIGQGHWELRSQGGGLTLYKRDAFPWFFSGPATGGRKVARYNTPAVFGIAYWIPVAMTMVLPAIWMIRSERLRRRVVDGLCLRCGYDLRASLGRCPECGDAIGRATPPAP